MSSEAQRERALRLIGLLDLTKLDESCTEADVVALCDAAVGPPAAAAVCVWPQYAGVARRKLEGYGVRVAAVVNFPAGTDDPERIAEDVAESVGDGATEIDLVMPWRAFLAGDVAAARGAIEAARESAASGTTLKVIVETGELGSEDRIRAATRLAISAGADLVKTSTGKTPVSATPEAARAMLEEIRASGRPVGFKASGGIRSYEDADLYLTLAEEILGTDAISPARFRIGASALHAALLAKIDGTAAAPGNGY